MTLSGSDSAQDRAGVLKLMFVVSSAKMFEKRKAGLNNVSWKIKNVSKDSDLKRSYTMQVFMLHISHELL